MANETEGPKEPNTPRQVLMARLCDGRAADLHRATSEPMTTANGQMIATVYVGNMLGMCALGLAMIADAITGRVK